MLHLAPGAKEDTASCSRDVEAKILAYALEHPTHDAQRVANELRLQNVNVGVSGVRGGVWSRHDLETQAS